MTRIFLTLAVLSLVFLVANLLVGLNTGDYQQIVREQLAARRALQESTGAEPAQQQAAREKLFALQKQHDPYFRFVRMHLFLGVTAALVTLLVFSVAITYFVGTSRWGKEVVEAYRLDPALDEAGQGIKRRSFRWSLVGIAAIITLVALGASADPTAWNHESSARYVMPHYLAAFITIVVVAWTYWQVWNCMLTNGELIERIMGLVQQAKKEHRSAKAWEDGDPTPMGTQA